MTDVLLCGNTIEILRYKESKGFQCIRLLDTENTQNICISVIAQRSKLAKEPNFLT